MTDAEMTSLLEQTRAQYRVPSLCVAVVRDRTFAFCAASGPEPANAVYSIASVTKQFVCGAIFLLDDAGALRVDDPVAHYFPNLTRANDISLRHLMTHTSGYPDFYPLSYADAEKRRPTTPAAIIERYGSMPLEFEPGSHVSYSNTGYEILGAIIERVSGVSLDRFLSERFFEPLGMHGTRLQDPPDWSGAHAAGYTAFALGPVRRASPECAGWMHAAGGLASTAQDLALWDAALLNGQALPAQTFARMTSPFLLHDGTPGGTACGWFTSTRGGHPAIAHDGQVAGFTSHNVLVPELGFAAVVLSNADYWQPHRLANHVLEREFPEAVAEEPKRSDHPILTQVSRLIDDLRSGNPDRGSLTPEFSERLTPTLMQDARSGLSAAGALRDSALLVSGERGGMAWYSAAVDFEHRAARAILRQRPDGKIAEFDVKP